MLRSIIYQMAQRETDAPGFFLIFHVQRLPPSLFPVLLHLKCFECEDIPTLLGMI